jgi:hypothetical protein
VAPAYPPTAAPTGGYPPAGTGAAYEQPTGQFGYTDPGAGGGGAYPPGPMPTPPGEGGGNKGLIIGLVVVIVLGLIGVAAVLLTRDGDDDVATDDDDPKITTTTDPPPSSATTDAPPTSGSTETTGTTDTTTPSVTETIDAEGEFKSVFDLEDGDCWDDPETTSDQVNEVEVLPCSEPHDNEIYHVFDLADGDFDATAVEEGARSGCLDEFDAFVGLPYADSELDVFAIWPTEESWAEGDREVLCSVYAIDLRKLVGSMEGEAI